MNYKYTYLLVVLTLLLGSFYIYHRTAFADENGSSHKCDKTTEAIIQNRPTFNLPANKLIEIANKNTLSNNLLLISYYYGTASCAQKLNDDEQIKMAVYRCAFQTNNNMQRVNIAICRKEVNTNTTLALSSITMSICMTNDANKSHLVLSNNYETVLEKRIVKGNEVWIPIRHNIVGMFSDMAPYIK